MGELIPFPIQIRENDYWCFYDPLARDGFWMSCVSCTRDCFRAGKCFIACTYHSKNPDPPEPYDYTPGSWGPTGDS